MEVLQHAAVGAVVAGGGLAAAQSLISRRLKAPSSLALSLGSFVGVFRLLEATGSSKRTTDSQCVTSSGSRCSCGVGAAGC
ncbi:hypothetical protein PR003_g5438 [Phytophthora rubi]|uniref:Uncharacterized protein n=1 Tax=Phytophthora rubi TaxID=129364 RepID=A0A6A3NMF2_9STRA|nr:hypothetical protein PR002_g5647 [Phytophthora rubi]KAE9044453.1 hypothetical protein PR001_g5350 [Phytophthora rubi]KAE9350264.1 hypothetical protein PR003_g5438 [Phytophthora rubi]